MIVNRFELGPQWVATRRSGFFPSLRDSPTRRAHDALVHDREVVVVALCAERALMSLRLNPALYAAFDAGPVDAADPLNAAHYYRVRARLPRATQ